MSRPRSRKAEAPEALMTRAQMEQAIAGLVEVAERLERRITLAEQVVLAALLPRAGRGRAPTRRRRR